MGIGVARPGDVLVRPGSDIEHGAKGVLTQPRQVLDDGVQPLPVPLQRTGEGERCAARPELHGFLERGVLEVAHTVAHDQDGSAREDEDTGYHEPDQGSGQGDG